MKDIYAKQYDMIARALEVTMDDIMAERQRQFNIIEECGDVAILAIHVMSAPVFCRIMDKPDLAALITLGASTYPLAIQRKIADVNKRLGQSQLTVGVGCGVLVEVNDAPCVG